jgi:uncharacterized repeat protein (TIGR03803 family)
VQQVGVSVQDTTTGEFWNGSSFSSATEQFLPATLGNSTWSLGLGALNDGHSYTVHSVAADSGSNTQPTPGAASFLYDTTAPATPSAPSLAASDVSFENITQSQSPTFTGTAEPNSSVEVTTGSTFLGQAVANASGQWSLTLGGLGSDVDRLPNGSYSIAVTATDAAGNVSGTATAPIVIADDMAPTVTLTAPANGSLTNSPRPTFTATASDSGSSIASVQFQYSDDGGATWIDIGPAVTSAPYSETPTSDLPDGDLLTRAVATDNAGNVSTGYSFSILASFTGSNGLHPVAGVTFDSSGNLFGTTARGGASNEGTVFEIAKGPTAITTVASFNGSNGAVPLAGVTFDSSGNLFGTTQGGGASGEGTVFEIAKGSTAINTVASLQRLERWRPRGRHHFRQQRRPLRNVRKHSVRDRKGPTAITTVASFDGSNGEFPMAGVTFDSSGDLFGTTKTGGTASDGTVFELTPQPTSFTVDATPPTATIVSGPASTTTSTSATFVFAGSDPTAGGVSSGVNHLEYALNGGSFVAAISPHTLSGLAVGAHTFQVRAVDNAGNVGAAASFAWTVTTEIVYVNSAWADLPNGSTIDDPDPTQSGEPPATIGVDDRRRRSASTRSPCCKTASVRSLTAGP